MYVQYMCVSARVLNRSLRESLRFHFPPNRVVSTFSHLERKVKENMFLDCQNTPQISFVNFHGNILIQG